MAVYIVEMEVLSVKDRSLVYWITSIATLGGFLFGYDTGIISGALVYINQSFKISTLDQELIVSAVVMGALCGAIVSGKLADACGRRNMLIVSALAFVIGSLLTTIALAPDWLILGRFIAGLAIGTSSYTAPLFISEIALAHRRGSLVLFNVIAITGGETLSFLMDYWLVPTQSWRLMFATGLIPALLLFVGMLFLPATPRWMALKGYIDKAKQTLRQLSPHKDIQQEWNQIERSLQTQQSQWRNIFSPNIRLVLIIGVALGTLQQFVGINTVMYYGPSIFKAAGFTNTSTQVFATFIMGLVNMIMSIVAVLVVDLIGRRKLLMGGMLLACFSLLMVGANFHYHQNDSWSHVMTLIFFMAYIAGYSISIGGLFWLIIAEIYPLRIRGQAMSFVTAVQWLANFIVSVSFLSILHQFGPANTFWLYGLMCAATLIFSFLFVPETKGLSLEQIEQTILKNEEGITA